MGWKDWITASGLVLTLATVLVRGGQLVERQDAANAKLSELTGQLQQLRNEVAQDQRDLVAQRGVDALHAEQLTNIRRELDDIKRRGRP